MEILATAFRSYRADPWVLMGWALLGSFAAVALRALLGRLPLVPWLSDLALAACFHGLVIRRLDRETRVGGRRATIQAGRGFPSRVLSYALALLALDVAAALAALAGLVAAGLLVLLLLFLSGILPSPLLTALVVFLLLLGPLLPLVVISMGGVFVGFTSVLGGYGLRQTLLESFAIARRHWRLVGAVVTITYGILFLIGLSDGLIDLYYTLHHVMESRVAVSGAQGARIAAEVRHLLGRLWDRLPHRHSPPTWWVWLLAPLLSAIPVPWVLAASYAMYLADARERSSHESDGRTSA